MAGGVMADEEVRFETVVGVGPDWVEYGVK